MNLIDEIKKHLPQDVVSKLGSQLGVGEAEAGKAVGAAVPSMLAGVSQMAQSGDGANKLATALKGLDLSALGNPAQALAGGGLGDIGGKMLGNLFGGSLLGKLGDAIGKFSGMGEGASKLLGLIAPFVMGGLAKKWMGSGGTPSPQGLTGMLNAEKANIAAAMPQGFSLGNMFSAPAAPTAPAKSGGGLLKILIPVAVVLGLITAVYFLFFNKPIETNAPGVQATGELSGLTGDAKAVGDGLTDTFKGLTETFGTIKDPASADEAMKKIPDLTTKVAAAKGMFDKLPGGDMKNKLIDFIKSKLGGLKGLLETALKIPGIGDKLKPAADLMGSLEGFTK